MGLGRRHGFVVPLLVETAHLVFLGQGRAYFEGFVEVALVAAEESLLPAHNNKTNNKIKCSHY